MISRSRNSLLVNLRTIRWRILAGLFCILLSAVPGVIWLWRSGESYFSLTRRLPGEVLVVEGWIGNEGIRAAAREFEEGVYKYIVVTGGLIEVGHGRESPNYAEIAEQELLRAGVPEDRILVAPTGKIERQRTYESALAAWQALRNKDLHPKILNVFTLGPHARRSRLVYAKVYQPETRVGIIAFVPPSYTSEPWWRSRARTKCFLKEIVGYPFEVLLNSGRISSLPTEPASPSHAG
jgi:uncharacterized SAM-binding protein YcdF (DUF218 family)